MAIETYDVIVIGLGAVGSAALCQAALRGARVLGIDRFHPPHDLGSSHGETRITRQAVGEGAEFVPLVLRANGLWRELEQATGEKLLVQNGGLMMLDRLDDGETAGEGATFYQRTVDCARQFNIEHEILEVEEMRRRFPQFNLRDGAQGYLERGAGYLFPEKCIHAQLDVAVRNRAEVRCGEIVTEVSTETSGVTLRTDRSHYSAARVVLAAGPWMADWARSICGTAQTHFSVYRQTLYWFALQQADARFSPGHMPIFLWSSPQVEKGFYGFPSLDGVSLKMATEQFEIMSRAGDGAGTVNAAEIQNFYDGYVSPIVGGVSSLCVRSASCFYTVVPDHGFLIDQAIDSDRVWFASACSGHGFKHSAAVGEVLAQKALNEPVSINLKPFARR